MDVSTKRLVAEADHLVRRAAWMAERGIPVEAPRRRQMHQVWRLDCGDDGGGMGVGWCANLAPTRVDSGRGQNSTLRPLSTFWPPVFAGEQDVGPPQG